MENYIITIGRQLGSGGKQTGEMLSQKLQTPCFDKELLQLAAKESGVHSEFFEQVDEKSRFSILSGLSAFWEGDFFTNNYLSNESLFKIQSDVIQELANKQSCIFVGRCADYILRNHPRMLSVFITANINDRIATITQSQQVTEEKAKTIIEQTDKKRASYYNFYSNKTWGAASSYDLCINASVLGIEETVACILQFVQQKFGVKL